MGWNCGFGGCSSGRRGHDSLNGSSLVGASQTRRREEASLLAGEVFSSGLQGCRGTLGLVDLSGGFCFSFLASYVSDSCPLSARPRRSRLRNYLPAGSPRLSRRPLNLRRNSSPLASARRYR